MPNSYVNMGCDCNCDSGLNCDSINIDSLNGSIIVQKLDPCSFNLQVAPGSTGGGDYTDADARAAVGANTPLTYDSGTGIFGIQVANATQSGYLSTLDWNYFEDKIDGAQNLGGGEGILFGVVSKVAQFKSLKGAGAAVITSTPTEITVTVPNLVEVDTLATVVARGGIVNLPISIQGLTISGIPSVGTASDDILVRDITGLVKTVPSSVFFPPPTPSLDLPIRTVIADDAVLADDFTLLVDTSFGPIDITFDPVAFPTKVVVIKKIGTDSNLINILPDSGTIDGFPTYSFDISGKPIMIQSNGTNLYIIGG